MSLIRCQFPSIQADLSTQREGVGGSSSLNAMVYIRGHAYDYDRWEKEGAEGWSYADCLPYFRKSQTHELGRCSLHFSTSTVYFYSWSATSL